MGQGERMRVTLVGYTVSNTINMETETDGRWVPEGDGDAADLVEFAGRQCYESWNRPNPDTATNVGYIRNLLNQQHLSVLEHGCLSFRVSDVSRALTHELVRHRHFSFSQVSQRYVNPVDSGTPSGFVVPPLFQGDTEAQKRLNYVWVQCASQYRALVAIAEEQLEAEGVTGHQARKMAREAARAVLPNMTPTALVVTANHHAWLDFFGKRGTIHADQEIRALAVELFRQAKRAEPNVYDRWTVEVVQIGRMNTEVIVNV
jgi:thymidylate synthase (FAD)